MTQQDQQLRMLREIITGIVISVILFLTSLYIPMLGFLIALVLPMPILFFRLKLGRNPAYIIALSVFTLITIITGGISTDILFYGALLTTALFIGEFLERRFSVEKVILYTCLSTLGICAAIFCVRVMISDQGAFSMISSYIKANLELTLKIYEDMGVARENIELISRSMDTIQFVLVRILPGIIVAMYMIVIWTNILFIKKILSKKGIRLSSLAGLNLWRAPERLVWIVILASLILLLPWKNIKIAALNFMIIMMPVYFFQGIAIISFFFEKKGFPLMLKIFIYSIIAIQQIFLLLIVGLGFFDTWLNFRKIDILNNNDA